MDQPTNITGLLQPTIVEYFYGCQWQLLAERGVRHGQTLGLVQSSPKHEDIPPLDTWLKNMVHHPRQPARQ